MADAEYLTPTKYCDSLAFPIRRMAYGIGRRHAGETAQAVAVFAFVRDEIAYRFDYPSAKASETLAKKQGNCFNKANLQIALLRACGIPAAYGVCTIKREVFRPVVADEIYEQIAEPTVHVYAACRLDERWLAADATVDRAFHEAHYRGVEGWSRRNWDGTSDLKLDPRFVVEEQGLYANIDLYLQTPPRFWTDELLRAANERIEESIRRAGRMN